MNFCISLDSLGSDSFKKEYNLKYPYVLGAMYRGISSKEMVVKMGKAGMLGFLGAGGLKLDQIEDNIKYIQNELKGNEPYGMNLICNLVNPALEEKTVDLFLKYNVRIVEAAAFMNMTPALVKYHLTGLTKDENGEVKTKNKIIAKISRPEVAELYLSPAPEKIVKQLLAENKITAEEAELSAKVPMADDITVEGDSGGHTDQGILYVILPAIVKLKNDMIKKYNYCKEIRIGAAGGIGTPDAAAAAFIIGADYIVTGSINQCTVEAGISTQVKDLLQQINVQDTEYAPAGDMLEIGAKVQVLKKGLFFPARANKLYDLYKRFNSIDEIDEATKKQLQERYFHRTFQEIYNELISRYPHEKEKAEKNGKHKMALIFKWYFNNATKLAISGNEQYKVDYQVNCGPCLGAFNQWVKNTELENWNNRHVDEIAIKLITATVDTLNKRFEAMSKIECTATC